MARETISASSHLPQPTVNQPKPCVIADNSGTKRIVILGVGLEISCLNISKISTKSKSNERIFVCFPNDRELSIRALISRPKALFFKI
jgi:hypothetical protein